MAGLKRVLAASAVTVAALLVVSTVSAKTLTYSGSRSGSAGDSQAGASYSMNSRAYANDASWSNEAYVRLWGDATAKLFGSSRQLASLETKVRSKNNAGTLDVLVKACGYNVVNKKESFPTGISKSYSKSYSNNFFSAEATFWVWIIPVSFRGSVGGGASINAGYEVGILRADLTGGPKAWGSASASAGIGRGKWSLASVGATAKLLETYLRSSAGIGFLSGQPKGGIYLDLGGAYADFWYKVVGFKQQTIASWSARRNTYTLATIR